MPLPRLSRRALLGGAPAALALLAAPRLLAAGAAPRAAADIAPVHSILAGVMEGAGTPALTAPPGVSPHGFSLRPSQAAAIEGAALAVTIGPAIAPWFLTAVEGLAPGAQVLILGEDGIATPAELAAEQGAHGLEHAGRDDEGHGDEGHGGGGHGGHDPHLWLDPAVVATWPGPIAEALAALDPANGALYRANAARLTGELDALTVELAARLAPLRGKPWVAFHDAWSRLETRFDLPKAGVASLSDATAPGPARIAALRGLIARSGAVCVFAEPQLPERMLAPLVEGTGARLGRLDPLGAGLQPGPALYFQLMRDVAAGFESCLGAE